MYKSQYTFNIETLRGMLLYAQASDRNFNYDKYLFVLGIDLIRRLNDQETYNLLQECKEGSLFGIKVCIDYNDKYACKIFKEV